MDTWVERIHPEDREQASTFCSSCTAQGEDHSFEYRCLTQDGKPVWIHDVVTVISGDDGSPSEMLGIMFDITESKQAEERQRKGIRWLETFNHLQEQLIAPGPADTNYPSLLKSS